VTDQAGMGPVDAATFVSKAAQGGMAEVMLARTAQSKTSNQSIRAFADRMIKDHGKANDELAAIAKRKGLQVPASLDSKHQAAADAMSAKSGAQFDSAYAAQMKQDHHETIALFEQASKLSDAELAGFARKTLPTLREHDAMAQKLPAR
jgi:putative membrane protein